MSDFDRKAARARCAAATEGPWFVVGLPRNPGDPYICAGDEDPHVGSPVADLALQEELSNADADAALIAHARTDLPAALDLLDQQDVTIAELTEAKANVIEWATEADGCFAELQRVKALLDRCEALLREHEWSKFNEAKPGRHCWATQCSNCYAWSGGPHASGCELAALLRDLGGSDG